MYLVLIIFAYFLYWRRLPPFTEENIAKLTGMFKGKNDIDNQQLTLAELQAQANKYIQPEPKVQLRNPKTPLPKAKTDPKIAQQFAQEMYKQLFLPYSQYPYLYDHSYIDGTRNVSGDIRDYPYNNPNSIVMGYRPPIVIGDQKQWAFPPFGEFLDPLYDQYGYFPPGGGGSYYYDNDFLGIDDLIQIGGSLSSYARAAPAKALETG